MAVSEGGISVGDAVLSFLADTTNLDAALARIQAETAAKLQPSGAAVANLGKGFEQAGTAAAVAAPQIQATVTATVAATTAAQQLGQTLIAEGLSAKDAASALVNLGYSQKEAAAATGAATASVVAEDAVLKSVGRSAAAAGTEVAAFGAKSATGLVSSRIELQSIDQALGVRLPRGITSLLSQLPGIGTAIDLAFKATVVFFLVEAVIKLSDAISKVVADTFIYTEAMQRADEVTGLLNKELAAQTDELKKLKDAYDLVGLSGTARTSEEFAQLTVAANKNAEAIRATSDQIYGLQRGLVSLPETITIVNQRISQLFKDLPAADLAKKLLPNDADLDQVLTVLRDFQVKFQAQEKNFNEQGATLQKTSDQQSLAEQIAVGEARIAATQKTADATTAVELQEALIRNSALKVSYLEDAEAQAKANEQKYQNNLQALQAQKALEDQKLQSDVNQLQVARAQEPKQAAAIDAQIQDVERQHAAKLDQIEGEIVAAELNHQAEQLSNARKFLDERQKLLLQQHAQLEKSTDTAQATYPTDKVDAFAKATDELTLSELRLADAQAKLALSNITQNYGPQEAAISALANFGIITEQEKAERLRTLYKQEEDEALQALNDLGNKEKTALGAAQAAVDKILTDPIGHQDELDAAQKYLDQLLAKYEATQKEIIATTTSYEDKRIALQSGAVAQAIALAQSEGKSQLAADLLEKATQLDLINNEIRLAKARGDNTAALEKERKAMQDSSKALVEQASRTKEVDRAIVELKSTVTEAAQSELQAFATATAAAISSQEAFGAALESGTLRVIAQLAQHWADYYFALAIAEAASGDWGAAAGHTAAAIAFEAVAGVASGIAANIDNSAQKSATGGTATTPNTGTTNSATTPAQQPVSVVNTPHLAGGGLLTQRTVAVLGDSPTGGDQREAVLPLGQDSNALDEIAGRIHERMGGGGSVVNHNYNIKGDLIDHAKLMREQTRQMKKGKGRMTVTNSSRLTRLS